LSAAPVLGEPLRPRLSMLVQPRRENGCEAAYARSRQCRESGNNWCVHESITVADRKRLGPSKKCAARLRGDESALGYTPLILPEIGRYSYLKPVNCPLDSGRGMSKVIASVSRFVGDRINHSVSNLSPAIRI